MRFILTGDIAGRVLVEADTIEEAIEAAEKGNFLIVDTHGFAYKPFDQAFVKRSKEKSHGGKRCQETTPQPSKRP